ncbi:hypothetical protein [Pedobacter sp. N36a]|uniref:hypothetical protein n=1 Tax=Pedobacter sp. N36a TaxID=2767996 RepID=UPI002102580B|nr:hypothetical protein [Pedobacter sp. N36a]
MKPGREIFYEIMKNQRILNTFVVSGKIDSKAIAAAIKKGNGKAKLTTVEGVFYSNLRIRQQIAIYNP